jgi:integrase
MRGGLQRHLLGDAGRWQPPLWIYAVVAVVIYFRGEKLVPDIRLHDLRHTHATLLLADGVPVKVVLEPIRHASATITLSAYQHAYPGMGLQVAHRFAALLEG